MAHYLVLLFKKLKVYWFVFSAVSKCPQTKTVVSEQLHQRGQNKRTVSRRYELRKKANRQAAVPENGLESIHPCQWVNKQSTSLNHSFPLVSSVCAREDVSTTMRIREVRCCLMWDRRPQIRDIRAGLIALFHFTAKAPREKEP